MLDPINRELNTHQFLRHKLTTEYPEADDQTLLDTLEGLTNLNEMLAAVVRSRLDDVALIAALKSRIGDMQERVGRIERRADKKKDVVTEVMDKAGLKKLEEADFTVSLRDKTRALVVSDEKQIPRIYWKAQEPKLDRQGLIQALKNGISIPGTALGNGGVTISVRTR